MKKAVLLGLVALMAWACGTTSKVPAPAVQLASLYNPSEYSLNVAYRIYHVGDEASYLFVRMFPGELLFNSANEEAEYRAQVEISTELYELGENKEMLAKVDSTVRTVKLLGSVEEQNASFASLVMRIPAGKEYLLKLKAKDLNRGSMGLEHLYVDKTDVYNAQNFSVVNPVNGYPKFQDYLVPGEVFSLRYRSMGYDTLYMDYLKSDSIFPKPPVTMVSAANYNLEVDTTIVIPYSDSSIFTLPDLGSYYFRLDSSMEEGVGMFNWGVDFPRIKTEGALLEPLFYLATQTEYLNLKRHANHKMAVDEFWLERNPTMERSKELIRIYYNRVLRANLYFTSDVEGWKTDRGMIFVLLGPPDRMRDTGAEQIWYYISGRQNKVVSYVFDRKMGQYYTQRLEWRKSAESMTYWSRAVSSWRKGRVFEM